mmetsp:Transcript_12358/g.24592  ORF Transcript_12358/g.24592 Transcript_12358/m.24592 type:complete len:191 (-) Transcript_12358:40-612(-)
MGMPMGMGAPMGMPMGMGAPIGMPMGMGAPMGAPMPVGAMPMAPMPMQGSAAPAPTMTMQAPIQMQQAPTMTMQAPMPMTIQAPMTQTMMAPMPMGPPMGMPMGAPMGMPMGGGEIDLGPPQPYPTTVTYNDEMLLQRLAGMTPGQDNLPGYPYIGAPYIGEYKGDAEEQPTEEAYTPAQDDDEVRGTQV